jgi:hypothetical protein
MDRGSTNFHDRNYQINHNVEASAEELEGGSSAEVSINITVSAAIISAAYHKSSSLAAVAEAELAVKEAKTKKAAEETPKLNLQPLKQLQLIVQQLSPKKRLRRN